jgi:hypothetical protein
MREINLETVRSAPGDDQHILRDHHNPLGALQEQQGYYHWRRMFLPLSLETLMTVPSDASGSSRHSLGNFLGQNFLNMTNLHLYFIEKTIVMPRAASLE